MQARTDSMAKGVDVSHWQGDIDWSQVHVAGYSFAYVKCTEGQQTIDDHVAENLSGAKAAGLAIGVYHFMRAKSPAEAIVEADFFVSTMNGMGGFDLLNLPPVVDVEQNGNTEDAAVAFIERVKEKTGLTCIVYSYPWFISTYFSGKLAQCPLWIANYFEETPSDIGGWTEWTFWQTSEHGNVPGIAGPVDTNLFRGSVEDLFVYKLSQETADVMLVMCKHQYALATTDVDRDKWHNRALDIRKAAGLPEDYQPK